MYIIQKSYNQLLTPPQKKKETKEKENLITKPQFLVVS